MLLSRSPIATTDSRTRPDSYSSRASVSSHSRKLANAQTERSVAATSTVLVTESVLSSTYQHCYWMRWESLYQVQWFHKTTVCNHCIWWSNYYHTIYMQLVRIPDDGNNYNLCYIILRFLYRNAPFTQSNSNNRFQNTPGFLLVPCVC